MQPEPHRPSSPKSTLAGLLVVGALVGFAALLFVANFQGAVKDDRGGPRSAMPSRGKAAKGAKAKGPPQSKAKVPKLSTADLTVVDAPYERPPAIAGAVNLVVVIPTAVRKDHLTPYGATSDRTPFLQETASRGAIFADLVSTGPLGRYATTSMLTGQIPAVVDMVDPGPGSDAKVLSAAVTTLPERLRDLGYRTYGVTGNFHVNTDTGLAQGFDKYRNAPPNGFSPEARLEGPAAVSAALQMLSERTADEAARPFYLQLDLVDAHGPVRNVKEVTEKFDPGTPGAIYRAAVFRTDGFVRDLWTGLGAMGFDAEDTLLVIVGDHGEGIQDPPHHGKAHGRYLYESSVAVPWIVAGPGVPAGRTITGLASSTDVMPTLLELLGATPPTGIDGQSWARQLRGEGTATTRTRAFSDTWFADTSRASVWTDRMACLKDFGTPDDPRDTFAEGCFDRKTDPLFTDVKEDNALLAELLAWRSEVSQHVTTAAPDATPSTSPEEATPAEGSP